MTRHPYHLRLLGRHEGLAIWRVNGHAIRDRHDVEFTNGHHSFTRPYIPEDEIWLDRSARGIDEWRLWLVHQIAERDAMARGVPYLQALHRGNRAERAERRRRLGVVARQRSLMRRRKLGSIGGRSIVLVDGQAVRTAFDLNFTLGGHGYRYRFIPVSEIWIDDAVQPAERPAIVHHEAVEVDLMAEGMAYHPAHARASRAEVRFRRARLVQYSAA